MVKPKTVSVLTSHFRRSSALSCSLRCVSACRPALSCYESVHLNQTRCSSWHAGGTSGPLAACGHACCCPDCTLLSFISQHCFTFATMLNATEQIFFKDSVNRNNHMDCHISFILNMNIHVLFRFTLFCPHQMVILMVKLAEQSINAGG